MKLAHLKIKFLLELTLFLKFYFYAGIYEISLLHWCGLAKISLYQRGQNDLLNIYLIDGKPSRDQLFPHYELEVEA